MNPPSTTFETVDVNCSAGGTFPLGSQIPDRLYEAHRHIDYLLRHTLGKIAVKETFPARIAFISHYA